MLIAGVNLLPNDAWLLAQRLHQAGHEDLAVDVASAVNANSSRFLLTPRERSLVGLMLEHSCPPELLMLRSAL